MLENQQECEIAEQAVSTDERLLAAFEEIELLREQVRYLTEVTESQNLYQRYQDKKLQEVKQELQVTNDDLCIALSIETLPQLTLEEALKLAKTILRSEKYASEFLAELLSAVYVCTVRSKELEQIDRISIKSNPLSNDAQRMIIANSKSLINSSSEMKSQCKENFQVNINKIFSQSNDDLEKTNECLKLTKISLDKSKECLVRTKPHLSISAVIAA